MRKRIQDFAYARFRYEKPAVQISTKRLELEVLQGEVYRGSFSISSSNGIPMRGIVYSSNPRMKCLTPDFEGKEVSIRYEFQSDGLIEDDVQKGEFIIIINGGEYNLSFVVSVTKYYPESSVGKLKNLFEFANLAQVSYEEAHRIFTSPYFENLIREKEDKERLLYRSVGAAHASVQGMEEFLIGIHKKQRVEFQLEEREKNFTYQHQDGKESVQLTKKNWGYLELTITSDHEAIEPVKRKVTSADFVGNSAEVAFIVHAKKLHPGKNYARLHLTGIGQSEVCEICIYVEKETQDEHIREQKELKMKLARLYLDYRMRRIVTGVWSKESCACLERLRELEPKNHWYLLYQAQALLVNKQRQEAEWLIETFERFRLKKDSPVYAYYLYLSTFREKEPSYVAGVFAQIEQIYQRNQENIRLFFIMLFLDAQLNQSRSRKLSAIEEKVAQGMYSPILYMEAYQLIRHDIYLLQKAGRFERRVLHWAVKEGELTPEIATHVAKMIMQVRKYHPAWYDILEACYQVKPEQEILQMLCSFCVKWNLKKPKHFVWYDKGIQAELRIAGLYEAWLECMGNRRIEKFPKMVMIYFQYQSNLGDKRKAQLYASIVRNKENQKSLYSSYQKQIQDFAIEQIHKGHIDENLAVIYENEWKGMAIHKELAEVLVEVCYAHKVICMDPQAVRVVVIHNELEEEQSVVLSQNQAYVNLYGSSYCIMAEDERGVRFIPKDLELKRLMNPGRYIRQCVEQASEQLPHLIHYFDSRKTYQTLQPEDLPRLLYLTNSDKISSDYKNEIRQQMIEYYYNTYTGEALDQYLMHADCEGLNRKTRNKLLELMIARGITNKAYEIVLAYGTEQVTVSKLLLMVGQKIEDVMFEEDAALIGVCRDVFQRGRYNEAVLMYLCRYFKGNVHEMERLWLAAEEFEIDTYELSERFITQILYTESYTKHMEEIFCSYFKAHGNEMIVMAYFSYFSYQYFVKDMVVSDELFQYLEEQILLGNPLNDSCRFAYFKWLSERRHRTDEQEELLEELLSDALKQHKFFAFYQRLPRKLLRKYQLHDKIILEYRTNPSNRVLIDYCYNEESEKADYIEEDMIQMHEGIFAKQFVVFFGEEIPYYIKEETPNSQVITESGHIKTHDLLVQGNETAYDVLNDLMISYQLKDYQTLRQLYNQYKKKQKLVEETFQLV